MVAPVSEDIVTNGVHNNDPNSHISAIADGSEQDLKVLRTELAAAAHYLQSRTEQDGLKDSIVQAEAAGDALGATNELADAFIRALDAPEDPNGSGSLEGCMQELLVWVKKKCAMNDDLVDKISNRNNFV